MYVLSRNINFEKGDYQDEHIERVASLHQTNHFLMYVRFTSADVCASLRQLN